MILANPQPLCHNRNSKYWELSSCQEFLLTILLNPVFFLFLCSFNHGLSVKLSHILKSGINENTSIFSYYFTLKFTCSVVQVELGLKNRLSFSSPTFSVAHTPYTSCTPQGGDKPPWILYLKMNSFPFKPLPQRPDKSRETEEPQPINILSKHTHSLVLRCPCCVTEAPGPKKWTAARLYCLFQPLQTPLESQVISQSSIHCCVSPAKLLAGKPRSFLPTQPGISYQIHSTEVCNFKMYPETWNCSHWMVK